MHKTMTTTEIIKLLAKRLGMNQKLTREALREVIGLLTQRLVQGETALMPGLGQLKVQTTKDRYGHIPGKGKCFIPARERVSFHQDKKIKNKLALDENEEIIRQAKIAPPADT